MSVKDLATKNTKDTKKVWPTVRLGDVCKVLTDGDWIESKDQSETGIRLIQTGNIGNGVFERKDNRARYISDATFSKLNCTEIYSGDVLISRLPEPVGRACIVEDMGCRMITAVDCSIVRFTNEVDSRFFIQYSQSSDYQAQVSAQLTGTTRARISRKHLSSVLIPCPPLSVQREIVARLEKELGEADRLAVKFTRVAELADDAFKAELDETFKALEDNSRRDAEARRVRLGDVCEFVRNGANIKQRKGAVGIPITRIETLSGGVFNSQKVGYADIMNKKPFEKHIVGIGDLLISHINSAQFVGRTVMYRGEINGPIIHGMNLLRARLLDSGKILPAYVELWFKTISARIYISGVTKKSVNQASVNTTDFKRMPIIRPPISTQRAIIAKLDAAKERCEKLKAAAMRGLAAAENLRKAILAEAFE